MKNAHSLEWYLSRSGMSEHEARSVCKKESLKAVLGEISSEDLNFCYDDVSCERDFYLTKSGLKPATSLSYSFCPPETDHGLGVSSTIKVLKSVNRMLSKMIDGLYVSYSLDTRRKHGHADGRRHKSANVSLYMSRSRDSMDAIMMAKSDREQGIAYGYPIEAVDGFISNGHYAYTRMMEEMEVIRSGKRLPSWLAYLSFVPETVNSKSSEKIGRLYQDYTRKNNPYLAFFVENDFYNFFKGDSFTKS